MDRALQWRQSATTITRTDPRAERFRVRELRQACWHFDAGKAKEKSSGKEATEAEQAKRLAFSLTASLAFRSLSLLALAGKPIPRQATAGDLGAHNGKALRIGEFALVVAERLFVKAA
jgi:hypothetical protein